MRPPLQAVARIENARAVNVAQSLEGHSKSNSKQAEYPNAISREDGR
jgi:hypothetical protein